MNKFYLLTFDPMKANGIAIHETIEASGYVNDWWHYLAGTYILSSSGLISDIHSDLLRAHPGVNFLLIEVRLEGADGWMPKKAWDWINSRK